MRDWVHTLIALRKFNREVKERKRKSKIELIEFKNELYDIENIKTPEFCNTCNTSLDSDDYRMEHPADPMSNALCGFCFSKI